MINSNAGPYNDLVPWHNKLLPESMSIEIYDGLIRPKYTQVSVFGAGFENNLSVGQVAQKIHLSWCCPKLSQILKNRNT